MDKTGLKRCMVSVEDHLYVCVFVKEEGKSCLFGYIISILSSECFYLHDKNSNCIFELIIVCLVLYVHMWTYNFIF